MTFQFSNMFNPFRDLSHEELAEAYEYYYHTDDVEAVALVCDAFDEDIYLDLTELGISTRDFQ